MKVYITNISKIYPKLWIIVLLYPSVPVLCECLHLYMFVATVLLILLVNKIIYFKRIILISQPQLLLSLELHTIWKKEVSYKLYCTLYTIKWRWNIKKYKIIIYNEYYKGQSESLHTLSNRLMFKFPRYGNKENK